MNDVLINFFVDNAVQCWGCPVFYRLFQIVSNAAAAVYDKLSVFCVVLFCVLFAFTTLNAVWKNLRSNLDDPWSAKSLKPLVVNSLIALTLLGMGIELPRFITKVTFEPTAQITLAYTQNILQTDSATIDSKITYQPVSLSGPQASDNGLFRPELRDTLIMLIKTTSAQFQSYIKIGIKIMDGAFTWHALLGIGRILKHFILFMMGLYLAYNFFKIFVKFCCYFIDIIVAMALFAFFFPISLTLIAFNNEAAPKWMSSLGKGIGANQIKKLIGAIISLAACVVTYNIVMLIIMQFFAGQTTPIEDLMNQINDGYIYDIDFDTDDGLLMMLAGSVVLVYLVSYLIKQIPKVTNMILSVFDVSEEHKLGDELGDGLMQLTKGVFNSAKNVIKPVITKGAENSAKVATANKAATTAAGVQK